MFIDEMVNHFKKLNIANISEEEYKSFLIKVHQMYKETTPGIPDNFEDLRNIENIPEMTERVMGVWSKTNNTTNPIHDSINNKIQNHSFFKNRKYVCAAPHTSLRFDSDGKMTVCCSNTDNPIGMYPENTPLEAWRGETMKNIRESLKRLDFSKGCMQCAKYILAGNINNTVLVNHDQLVDNPEKYLNSEWPSHMVFQHQNICNYECIMCGGKYSALIAKNRDRQPFVNRYDTEKFIDDIRPFIKHVRTFEFLGGEPLLISQHYKIWDIIKKENPTAKVHIISNGSVYNSRVESILKELPNSLIHVSLDAVTPEIYSYIRRNGNIETVKENIRKFKSIKRLGSITVCPMIQNIRDIPNVIEFCKEVDTEIWFNDVQDALGSMWEDLYENGSVKREDNSQPVDNNVEKIKEFRLWKLPKDTLRGHIQFLTNYKVSDKYKDRMNSFINYLNNYVDNINC